MTPPTKTRQGTERKKGSWECGEVTYGHSVGYQLDVGLGAGKKSLEKSDLRYARGISNEGQVCTEGMGAKLPLPSAKPTERFFCALGFQA